MSDPIDCTDCWNGDDCELHPSAPVTDDSTDVGPAIKAYTIQEKRHEKELTKFKTERDALEKRCELQLETIRDLRLQLDLVTEDRQVEIETRQRLQVELTRTKNTLEAWQSCTDCWNGDECERHPRKNDDDIEVVAPPNRQVTSENEHLKQVTSEHTREVNRLTVDNDALRRDLYSVINERDQAWGKIVELRAELTRTQNQLKSWQSGDELAHAIEVKNRCVATINKLCSQVVELQAQLKAGEK